MLTCPKDCRQSVCQSCELISPEKAKANGGRVFRSGFVIAMLMTVPILNLIMPVVAAAYMTHVYHALRGQKSAA